MKRFAKTCNICQLLRMKILCMMILISASCYAQSYEARTINLVDGSAPDLEAYQANLRGYEWTVKNGSAAVNLTGNAPFMYWYQEPLSASIVTARITIVSATGGTFRAVFLPSDLNPSFMSNLTSGATNLRYGIGVDYSDGPQSVKHGRFRLLSDPFSAGSVGITFYSTNVNWALINWSGLPSYLTDAPTDGGIYARKSAAWYSISGYATGGQWAADIAAALVGVATGTPLYSVSGIGTDTTARAWAQSGSNLAATAFGWGNHASAGYATGAPVYSLTGYATGTPVYAESDPIWSAASNSYLTTAAAESRYATGTPVYAVSGLGTDATARAWALGASNRADAAYAIAAAAATGTPLYAESFTGSVGSVVGLATGTPLYAESDPVFVASSNALLTKAQAALLYATGTPLYVESNPSLAALSNGVANATTTGSLALAVANAASNLAAGGISAVVASNSFFGKAGGAISGNISIGFNAITNIGGLFGDSGFNINMIDGEFDGADWEFNGQPIIPGYFLTTGAYNLSLGTNAPAAWTNQPSLLALSNGLAAASELGTNAQIAASNAQTTASAATNLAYAIGAGATNGILNVGLVATNAQRVASNGLATAQAAQVQASNLNAGAWSQQATGDVDMAVQSITNVHFIQFGRQAVPDTTSSNALYVSSLGNLRFTDQNGSALTIATASNLTSLGIQTVSAYNTALTNTLWRHSGFIRPSTPTNDGIRGQAFTTNGYLVWYDQDLARWLWLQGSTNVFPF